LRDDLSEKTNLAAANPGKVQELQALLAAWRKNVNALMPQPNPDFARGVPEKKTSRE
jgi:hypothetical protein